MNLTESLESRNFSGPFRCTGVSTIQWSPTYPLELSPKDNVQKLRFVVVEAGSWSRPSRDPVLNNSSEIHASQQGPTGCKIMKLERSEMSMAGKEGLC